MRFDRGKAWPHPVLRPPDQSDDYPEAEFEVDIECSRSQGGNTAQVAAEFVLSDPYLLKLVEDKAAEYVLVIRSTSTYFRTELRSTVPSFSESFAGELSGRVEFSPFLVATTDIEGFSSDSWHDDFRGRTYSIRAGAVLAEDVPKHYWIDAADEAPYGAAMEVVEVPGQPDGRWKSDLNHDRIQIQMSPDDHQRLQRARANHNRSPEGQYLMNGLYLPALISTLIEADRNPQDYTEYRWYSTLNNRLQDLGCALIGATNGGTRAEDAQKVLDSPFAKMPMIAEGD